MEKAVSVEERIRRAEEIYNKRNGQYISRKSNKKRKASTIKRLLMQIFVCLMIYLAFYVFTNSNYIFSEQFLNQVKSTFGKDSSIYNVYLNAKSYIENIFSPGKKEENKEQNSQEENVDNENKEQSTNEEAIGGAEEGAEQKAEVENKEEKKTDTSKSQMEKDVESIKSKTNFINPISGRISSTFGWRTPTTKTVPKYHTGLDIAAETGTVIKSATEGKVILASSEGDYGNHYKIETGNIIIIYAHCSKLYLKEGAQVKQGDKIAEVGSTGNSTGPHLHFEIRIEDRLVDPQLILNI